jgi:diguanylate cyclase (GGDEF)-like protein
VSFELKLAFLRELDAEFRLARTAYDQLTKRPRDPQALSQLDSFFHKIAGTAEAVGLPLLGSLAAVCERLMRLTIDGQLGKPEQLVSLVADALMGVASVLEQHGVSPQELPRARFQIESWSVTQPAAAGDERLLSKVLVVDDDPFGASVIDSCLRAAGFLSSYVCNAEKALDQILAELPDLIILDVVMPRLDGFELCRRVRAHPALRFTPVIFVTRKDDVEQRVRGLEVGGNDYVAKPFEPSELIARVRSHLQHLAVLRDMAIRDGLTRCYNHKYFKARLVEEVSRARRYEAPLTVAMLDIDRFKEVNDKFGHLAGDSVLAQLSTIMVASLRSTDVVARYGGEEFGMLLIQSGADEATIVTNRLRERIASQRFALPDTASEEAPPEIVVTVSIGVAQLDVKNDDPTSLIQRADNALYEAKTSGRNQVKVLLSSPAPRR